MDFFSQNTKKYAPLADRMRPNTLNGFVGQEHIVGEGKILRKAINNGSLGSCIFYGPPGTGKTTLANIIANISGANFIKLNAISSGVSDSKEAIQKARNDLALYGKRTYLLLDECHRWNKAQSDSVLEAIEDGSIIFIGSTTENPYTSMTRAIVSRCRVYEFKSLSKDDVKKAVLNALFDKENGLGNLPIDLIPDALEKLCFNCGGDVRNALNTLELAVGSATLNNGKYVIDKGLICDALQENNLGLDETEYYDILSCFCKSIRGSDSDAALIYAFKLIESGIDPLIILRRLIAHCSEDIGMANSKALVVATSALTAYKNLGSPEGLLPLAHAIVYACESPKSNSVYLAKNKAEELVKTHTKLTVPNALKNHPSTNEDGTGHYKYPHDYGGYVQQNYMPKELLGTKLYTPFPADETFIKKNNLK